MPGTPDTAFDSLRRQSAGERLLQSVEAWNRANARALERGAGPTGAEASMLAPAVALRRTTTKPAGNWSASEAPG